MSGTVAIINGVSIWHVSEGEGVPLVMLHGGPGSYDYLEPLADLLDPRVYRTIRYEMRGSRRSGRSGPYEVETFLEDLEQLRIRLGIEAWIVCGHSWGASLGLAYTIRFPHRVMGLLYLSGTGVNPAWHAEYKVNRLNRMAGDTREEYLRLKAFVSSGSGEEQDRERAEARVRELSLLADLYDPANYERLPRADGEYLNREVHAQLGAESDVYFENETFRSKLASVTVPCLFMHGEADPRPYAFVRELAGAVPNGTFVLLPRAGHYPWLDQPDALQAQLTAYLDRLTGGCSHGKAE